MLLKAENYEKFSADKKTTSYKCVKFYSLYNSVTVTLVVH